jgi:sugar phosphate isomerase/epimerase
MNRREFIGTSIAASTVLTLPLSWASSGWSARESAAAEGDHRVAPIGLQLYTVREMMKTDVPGTIAKVAAVGYKEVEMAGYFDQTPKQMRAILDSHGMTSPSSHISFDVTQNGLPAAIDIAHTMGQSFLICPYLDDAQRKDPEIWKRSVDLFNTAGETCNKAGIQFCYHNHTFEFEPSAVLGGKLPYDYLLENCDAKLVKMELDLCWITVAGADPLVYFKRYPGRFPLVHVKDWQGQGGKMSEQATRMRNVGQGDIDFKRIFAQSDEAGIKHYVVENDAAKSIDDPAASFKYLSNLRY